jgi:hypothetical protein
MEKETKKIPIKSPIRIVPDANILFDDPFLKSVTARTITETSSIADIKLVFSDVTIDETRNNVSEQLEKITDYVVAKGKKAEWFELKTGIETLRLPYEKNKAMKAWEEHLGKLAKTITILPYPNTTLRDLALRSIHQCRPFLEGDKGFRDCLLWIALLEAASKNNYTYILVSNDHGFYDGKESENIHPTLEDELKSLKLSGRVIVRRSLVRVVEDFIKPILDSEQIVEIAIKSGKIVDFTEKGDSVSVAINEYLWGMEVPAEWISKSYYDSAEFDIAEDVTMTELVSTLKMDDSVLVTSKWDASVSVNLHSSGYQEDYETMFINFTIESIVNSKTLKTESHEVVDSELTGWWDEETRERITI